MIVISLCVKEVQELLDAGLGISKVASKLNVHHQTLRRFIDKHDLEFYVPFDEIPVQFLPVSELMECVYIRDDFKVVLDIERLNNLSALCGYSVSYLKSAIKPFVRDLEKDALSEFVCSLDFDEVNNNNITRYRHIVYYIYNHYEGLEEFREMYGIDFDLVSFSSHNSRSFFANAGHKFEYLVGKVLRELYGSAVNDSYFEEGCKPDFVVNNRWVDAKLSKSTILSPSCETVEKYSKVTQKLTIIFCIDDAIDVDLSKYSHVDFIHVTDLFPYISDELVKEISELKKEVKKRKGLII